MLDRLYRACAALAGLCPISICFLMMAMSLDREIAINARGSDDIGGWLCASMATPSLAYGFENGDIVRVGLLIERFDGRARRAKKLVCRVVGTLFTDLPDKDTRAALLKAAAEAQTRGWKIAEEKTR